MLNWTLVFQKMFGLYGTFLSKALCLIQNPGQPQILLTISRCCSPLSFIPEETFSDFMRTKTTLILGNQQLLGSISIFVIK